MKAILQSAYGAPRDVLRVGECPAPAPGPRDVLVNVRAASVHPDVWHVITGYPRVLRVMGSGFRKPKQPIPGTDMSGVVVSVGAEVSRFRAGDEVFGETILGMQWVNGGAFAEYVVAPEESLELKPPNVSFEQAAAVATAGLIALINLRAGEQALRPGGRVLINGAGGGVGAMALQIAKARGAHVTAVDNTAKQDMLRTLGADRTIDYTRENFTRPDFLPAEERYGLVFDVASTLTLRESSRLLAPGGKYVMIGHDHFGAGRSGKTLGSIPRMMGLMIKTPFNKNLPKADFKIPKKRETMPVLRALLEQGHIAPIIDRTYPLEGVVDALSRLQSGEARGRLVLTP